MTKIILLLHSMRPKQWTKNVLLFGGIVFSRHLFDAEPFLRALIGFAVFCVLSGFVYVLNDITDIEKDKMHPKKRLRPIAAGKLAPSFAMPAISVLALIALAAAYHISPAFAFVSALYLVIQVFYSYKLKHIVMLDIMTISAGFVIRALAGAVVVDVEFSNWLIACTIFLSLFLAIAKRRHELVSLGEDAISHRIILKEYTPQLLDQMISIVTASTILAYTLYTMSPETAQKFGTKYLYITVPFVLYGLLRYLYLVYRKEMGGSPAQILLDDAPLIIDIFLWIACILILVYWPDIYALFG
ncbi:MAG: decaprenyl-phosphate phosphoribosyltransferase [Candidatus Coatesbacteria bacterium]|nr:decaprenyl-phosphate phosphoribosyltransferase [Candidatus Coatesbacteria bacterium]